MSFLDRVTKAVGETVDRGKKEMDLFLRIQKIKGEISQIEAAVRDLEAQVQQVKQAIGDKVLGLLRAGSLSSPEFQELADQIAGVERDIAAQRAVIEQKQADIERLKAEEAAAGQPPAVQPAAGPGPASGPDPTAMSPAPDPVCAQCGARLGPNGAFCPQCGTKRH
jgi:septal ring factor EnvC (AmiA/AmiB activator)